MSTALKALNKGLHHNPGARLALFLLVPALLALGLGYLWPHHTPSDADVAARQWQWPASPAEQHMSAQPELLARFWPLSTPDANAEQESVSTDHTTNIDWRLVAVIRQGGTHQALLLDPTGKLQTLSTGEALDDHRQVTAISATELQWQRQPSTEPTQIEPEQSTSDQTQPEQSEPQQGILPLFPRPAVTSTNNMNE